MTIWLEDIHKYSKIRVSFSGGRTSAVMTKWILERFSETHEIGIVFANTGYEHEATLEFVDNCDKYWNFNTVWVEAVINPEGIGVTHKIVDFETASRKGEPFEEYIKKYGIPNPVNPSCTARLKTDVMDSYFKSIQFKSNALTAIGIRADEIDRVREHFYPLVEWQITKEMVNAETRKWPFDLELPSDAYGNCKTCWKKSDRKLFTIALQSPEEFNFFDRMEKEYGHIKADHKAGKDGRRVFFRKYRSTQDILNQAQDTQFEPYEDSKQRTVWDYLDVGGSCSDSCEAF